MPASDAFLQRIGSALPQICDCFGTPFHLYDEAGILTEGRNLNGVFGQMPGGFQEYFAVKANPNLIIMKMLLKELGFGFDCSSNPELIMARMVGAKPDDIMFTSNNTSPEEYQLALDQGGCILNLDDITFVQKVPQIPERICFRFNPGQERTGNTIIGEPHQAKYGVRRDQIVTAYKQAMDRGAIKFGIHTMICSNSLSEDYLVQTVKMLLNLIQDISAQLGIKFEFINMGGGLGIPYRPEQQKLDIWQMASRIKKHLEEFAQVKGYAPKLLMESGRFITGPHGVLITRAINLMEKHFKLVGVDACMSALMRPAVYDAYHHITVYDKNGRLKREITKELAVVGSLCENWDQFVNLFGENKRLLPDIAEGDILVIHDTGAHGHAMGFNYNGRLRPQELLLQSNNNIIQIRRAETVDDYLKTQNLEFPTKMSL